MTRRVIPSRAGGVLESAAQHLLVGRVGARTDWERASADCDGSSRAPAGHPGPVCGNGTSRSLIALADDAKLKIGAVDGADFQGRGLAYAQAAGVHEGEAGLVNRVPHAAQQRADLLVRQDLGKTELLGRANSFF